MKKFILSTFVIMSFGFYVIFQNSGNSSANFSAMPPVVATNMQKKTPTQVATTTPKKPSLPSNPAPKPQTPTPMPAPVMMPPPKKMGIYNDGTYTGNSIDAYYGYVQVKAIITNGRLTDVVFLDYPQDRNTSIRINSVAMPILKQEAIRAQNANVDGVSGASATSPAFVESLTSALNQAKA